MSRCLKVLKKKGEFVRIMLRGQGLLEPRKKISSDSEFVYLPLKQGVKKEDVQRYGKVVSRAAKRRKKKPRSIAAVLKGKLSSEEMRHLKTSYDVFGEVAVLEISPELEAREKEIGKAFLELYPSLRAVFKKAGPVRGTHRVRALKRIAGTGDTETTYKEHGCTFKFDIAKVFFTPRLSTERCVIAGQVKPNEVVVDLFAGAGPFAVLIAKKQPLVKHIHAIDINPHAVQYLEQNAILNKVSHKITSYTGDATKIVPKKLAGIADRVIMNLPRAEEYFLPTALDALKGKGIVHYYAFAGTEKEVREKLRASLKDYYYKIKAIRNVKPYSPEEFCFGVDLYIRK